MGSGKWEVGGRDAATDYRRTRWRRRNSGIEAGCEWNLAGNLVARLATQLRLALTLGIAEAQEIQPVLDHTAIVGRMLSALIRSLEQR